MVDIRGFNGGMDTDSAPELIKPGDYTYAMNVSVGAEGMTNLLGNRLPEGFPAPTNEGTEWVCGAFFDRVRQRVIYFTNKSNGEHRIIAYLVPSISNPDGKYVVVYEDLTRIFGYWDVKTDYDPSCIIKDIKVIHREYEGDLYYFIDPKKKLKKFNYDTLLGLSTVTTPPCALNWTSANYTGVTLRDGTPIQQVTDNTAWAALTVPAWCYYDNNPDNEGIYGKLYNFYAVTHPLFAPSGFRVPSDTDWTNLITCLGGESVAGGKLKSISNLWSAPNTGATNESFFNALPGGFRSSLGTFVSAKEKAFFWTSTEENASFARYVEILNNSAAALDNMADKKLGFSVRLIKES